MVYPNIGRVQNKAHVAAADLGSLTVEAVDWPFKMDDGLYKVETGYNLLMKLTALTKCLIVYIYTGLLAVSFYLMFGATLS